MVGRVKLPDSLSGLTRTELERVIYEAALHEDDEYIAKERLIGKRFFVDIAADFDWDRKAVERRYPNIVQQVERVARKLYPT